MKNTRWAKITSEWTPRDGKRLRGRPKRRWRDDIEEAVGSQWMRTAQDTGKLWRPSASSGIKMMMMMTPKWIGLEIRMTGNHYW